MKSKWTKEDLRKLYDANKVGVQDRPYVETVLGLRKKIQTDNGKIVSQAFKKRSVEKEWIELNLVYWCNAKGLQLVQEYRFHPERKWKSDWAIPSMKILIEYEGMNSEKSGHLTFGGYTKDTEKYREASKLGYTILRYTMKNYKVMLQDLNEIITHAIKPPLK